MELENVFHVTVGWRVENGLALLANLSLNFLDKRAQAGRTHHLLSRAKGTLVARTYCVPEVQLHLVLTTLQGSHCYARIQQRT